MTDPFCVLALDQGTTSSRALVFDAGGGVLGAAQEEFAQHFPAPGLVEHDAREIVEGLVRVAERAVAESGVSVSRLAAVGITNQRETVVVWDRESGAPIHRAIVWQDRRTARECARLVAEGHEPAITAHTGLVVDPYFSATKIAWILDHVEGARGRAERGELAFGTIDAWVLWNLTGGRVHATDASNASRTLLFNPESGDWDPAMLERFRVPRAVLPAILPTSGVFGEVAAGTGFDGVCIGGMAGDQQAALFGQACFRPGMAKNTYGTGCFVLLNTGERLVRSRHRLLSTVAWRIGDRTTYALEGSIFIGGAAVQWLRDGLGVIAHSSEVEPLAASVDDSDDVILVPAFTGLGAPYWNPDARGAVFGLTRGTRAAHLARAALESIAFQTHDVLATMREDSGMEVPVLRVDGGASVNDTLMQFQADLLDIPVDRARRTETTALGAALLAGLAVGVWPDLDAVADLRESGRTFTPAMESAERDRRLAGWRRAIDATLHWTSSAAGAGAGDPERPRR